MNKKVTNDHTIDIRITLLVWLLQEVGGKYNLDIWNYRFISNWCKSNRSFMSLYMKNIIYTAKSKAVLERTLNWIILQKNTTVQIFSWCTKCIILQYKFYHDVLILLSCCTIFVKQGRFSRVRGQDTKYSSTKKKNLWN